jgi:BMFP domain-containing protein YqiC
LAEHERNAQETVMQTQNRLLDDLARVAGGALGVASGMRSEIEARLREQFERILNQMDLVPREEFDAVKAMAAKARAEQERLEERVAALEAQIASQKPKGAKGGASARKAPAGKAKDTSPPENG